MLESGDIPGGTRRFVEDMMGASWDEFPPPAKETFLRNALTWLDEVREGYPQGLTIDLQALAGYTGLALLTQGDQSPPFFGAVLDKVATALPQAKRHTYSGAGHNPHMTNPDEYARTFRSFVGA